MSYSFLDNLWDTDDNAAFMTPPGSASSSRRAIGTPLSATVAPMAGLQPMVVQQQPQPQPQPQPHQQEFSMGHMRRGPNAPVAAQMPPSPDWKHLLSSTIAAMNEQSDFHAYCSRQMRLAEQRVTKSIDQLSYILYALLAVCVVMAALIVLLCYKMNARR